MGERVWLARGDVPIPRHHALWAGILTGLSGIGLPPLLWGLYAYIWALLLGLTLTIGAKMWFLDRMVWLFDDMAKSHASYAAWMQGPFDERAVFAGPSSEAIVIFPL